MRGVLIAFPVLLIACGLIGLYAGYGELEPCRVLAVEQARRANSASLAHPDNDVLERWARLSTSQMSSGACAGSLLDSWGERIRHKTVAR